MTRRYRTLVFGVLAAAALVAVATRLPRRPAAAPPPAAPAPVTELAIEVRDRTVVPDRVSVPKGHRVRLTVTSAASRPVRLRLTGYPVAADSLAPGAVWRAEFLAELPGDDFAWLIDDRPAGRLNVSGSHLVEGHR